MEQYISMLAKTKLFSGITEKEIADDGLPLLIYKEL